MRGELIGAWGDAWREIWSLLADADDVPVDVFCELYRILIPALKDPSGEAALMATIKDAIHLREAFELSAALAGSDKTLEELRQALEISGAIELHDPHERRVAAELGL